MTKISILSTRPSGPEKYLTGSRGGFETRPYLVETYQSALVNLAEVEFHPHPNLPPSRGKGLLT